MERINLLGVTCNLMTMQDLNASIAEAIARNQKKVIANHNLHSIYLYHHIPEMQAIYEIASDIHIDGMPLVYWGKYLGYPIGTEHRITYVDWIDPLIKQATQNNWRIFYLGGKPAVAERAAKKLREKYESLKIDTHHGYFSIETAENDMVLQRITQFQTNILFVGMGMPRQELWILRNIQNISANVILPSGACFDYIAGEIPTPNRKIAQLGLEWFLRLVIEPRRLWSRYLLEPWALFPWFWKDFWYRTKNA